MNARPICIPCFFKQAYSAISRITSDEALQHRVLKAVMDSMPGYNLDKTAASHSTDVLKIVNKMLNCDDPFYEDKKRSNKIALSLFPKLKEIVKNSDERLLRAFELATAGNMIDLGILRIEDIDEAVKKSIDRVIEKGYAKNDFDLFRERLGSAKNILYIADNAGEIVFDKLVFEELQDFDLTVAVKSKPVLNDAMMDDAVETNVSEVAKIIENGSDETGTNLETCSDEFIEIFNSADIVISKGQANFETLDEVDREIFFVTNAKCPLMAEIFEVEEGDAVFKLF